MDSCAQETQECQRMRFSNRTRGFNGKVRLDPKIKRLIVPGLWTDDVRSQLGQIAFAKGGCVEISRPSKVLYVSAITFKVPFQFGEREVVCLKGKQSEAGPHPSVERHQPARVVFRGGGHSYDIEIDAVPQAERRLFSCQ